MRFLYKRPKLDEVREELNTVLEVMVSDTFVLIDLFLYSLIFTLLLSPLFHSIWVAVLFFGGCFSVLNVFYFFIFNRLCKKR